MKRIVLTKHGQERMFERKISYSQISKALEDNANFESARDGCFKATDDKSTVIFKDNKSTFIVITAYPTKKRHQPDKFVQ